MAKQRIWLILLLLSCSGCLKTSVQLGESLQTATSLMQERPDSALSILRDLNPQNIVRQRKRAEYALLYSQALDKNYIDETND